MPEERRLHFLTATLGFEIRDSLRNTWVGASAPTGNDQAYTIYSTDKIAINTMEEIIVNCGAEAPTHEDGKGYQEISISHHAGFQDLYRNSFSLLQ